MKTSIGQSTRPPSYRCHDGQIFHREKSSVKQLYFVEMFDVKTRRHQSTKISRFTHPVCKKTQLHQWHRYEVVVSILYLREFTKRSRKCLLEHISD